MSSEPMIRGRLVYLMGASGSGKDTLLQTLRTQAPDAAGLLLAHRYITRPWHAGGENHIELSQQEFDRRQHLGLFSLHWQAHGLSYGIGVEAQAWLEAGCNVLVNGSRAQLQQAQQRFGAALLPVLLQVNEAVLRRRLEARGRESEAAIAARLLRAREYAKGINNGVSVINNDGPIDQAAHALCRLLTTPDTINGGGDS
ncbi:ribose 1,5-bisphosphokinase [Marinobacterium aestuarii]|nr:ribose 1,5-bisphosphokinase [Marinobacterium aestuarii]